MILKSEACNTIGKQELQRKKPLFDNECRQAVDLRKKARLKSLTNYDEHYSEVLFKK